MFTGIVTELGSVARAKERKGILDLEVSSQAMARELRRGDSVAVNGVCLTATEANRRNFRVQAMQETLSLSTLGRLSKGDPVNLELPVRVSDRLGGHIVQGHVDGVVKAIRVEDEEGARRVWFNADDGVLDYLVPKGSVALDGVSLTIVDVGRTSFQVALIPTTLRDTTLGRVAVGSAVNLEVDVIAKYVERLLTRR